MIIPLDFISIDVARNFFDDFLNTPLDTANPKHQLRVNKLIIKNLNK
jgi:hypothetical protein